MRSGSGRAADDPDQTAVGVHLDLGAVGHLSPKIGGLEDGKPHVE